MRIVFWSIFVSIYIRYCKYCLSCGFEVEMVDSSIVDSGQQSGDAFTQLQHVIDDSKTAFPLLAGKQHGKLGYKVGFVDIGFHTIFIEVAAG